MGEVRLPRYVRKRLLASGAIGHFWELPSWARPPAERFGRLCPVRSEPLGSDIPHVFSKGDLLNSALDDWRTGIEGKPAKGSVKELFGWYRGLDRFKEASFLTRRDYVRAMKNVEALQLKTVTLSEMIAAKITAVHADAFYKALTKKHGKRGGGYCMQICRRVWNEAMRHGPVCPVRITAAKNPFERMNIKMVAEKGNRATSRAEYDAFRVQARADGIQSMATAAAIAFELVRRVSDVFGYVNEPGDELDGFFWEGYKPGVEIAMTQGKTGIEQVIPLRGDDGSPLYPDLEEELARSWREGLTGHIVLNEATGGRYDEQSANRTFKRICKAAGLPKAMTLTGFRHGGATELGDAGVVDIRPISGHKTLGQTATYNKANESKARTAGQARRKHVTKGAE
jgi:hypothetical protein